VGRRATRTARCACQIRVRLGITRLSKRIGKITLGVSRAPLENTTTTKGFLIGFTIMSLQNSAQSIRIMDFIVHLVANINNRCARLSNAVKKHASNAPPARTHRR
jgi:hypothetical protein